MPSSDILLDLVKQIDLQDFKYIIAIIKPDKKGSEDSIDLYSSFNKGQFERLIEILKGAKIEKPEKIDIKNEKEVKFKNKEAKKE
jgi:hypothetical protein